ncbi:hypothetical protein [Pseudomonas sp. GM_Psu_2]|uniref:hypothetical protein n=1 Tax=unclassified Pseudomonas TaxID=196821 RepID=UPI00226ADDB9|nr:hypothetical protein [Pseudomonas sp. GM_Psu_2]
MNRADYVFRQASLFVLESWYSTWDAFKQSRDPVMRSGALMSKAMGIVCYDRLLTRCGRGSAVASDRVQRRIKTRLPRYPYDWLGDVTGREDAQ